MGPQDTAPRAELVHYSPPRAENQPTLWKVHLGLAGSVLTLQPFTR